MSVDEVMVQVWMEQLLRIEVVIVAWWRERLFRVRAVVVLFLDRNLDTSQPSSPRDTAPPLLRLLRPGSTSAQVCSGLLTHPTRNRQLLIRSLKRPPFPARDPKSVPTIHLFLDNYPSLPIFIYGTFFCL